MKKYIAYVKDADSGAVYDFRELPGNLPDFIFAEDESDAIADAGDMLKMYVNDYYLTNQSHHDETGWYADFPDDWDDSRAGTSKLMFTSLGVKEAEPSNKAQFRALREACGISQAVAAEELDVDIRTVKRWEGPNARWIVPDDAMAYVVDAHDEHMRAVSVSVDAARKSLAQAPEGAVREVRLTYYRTQEEYDACGRDVGYFGIVNARSRAIGEQLEADGVQVRYAFPGDGAIRTPGSRY